jgi:hypothetical protein
MSHSRLPDERFSSTQQPLQFAIDQVVSEAMPVNDHLNDRNASDSSTNDVKDTTSDQDVVDTPHSNSGNVEASFKDKSTPLTKLSSSSSDDADNKGAKVTLKNDHADKISSREQFNHLVQDLVMIAKTAFNLHAQKRGWITTNSLKESIMFESTLRDRIGSRYSPSYSTPLDGNIALAKETIARHTVKDIQCWMSEETSGCGNFCFLNVPAFKLPIGPTNGKKLAEDLIRCFSSLLSHHGSGEKSAGSKITLADSVAYELVKHGHSSTFAWINNQSKFLLTQPNAPGRSTPNSETHAPKPKKAKEPYPTVDQRLLDFISTHLQVIVVQQISAAGNDVPKMSDETKVTTFIFKLASDFLIRNKGWHNENSFTSPQHLQKLEEVTGLKSRPSESILTFNILRNTIDEFRARYKAKHPKGIPTQTN